MGMAAQKALPQRLTTIIQNLTGRVSGIFRRASARRIDESQAQRVVQQYTPYFRQDIERETDRLLAQMITPAEWAQRIEKALTNLYLTAGMAGSGHVGRMMPELLDDITRAIQEQRGFLQRFAKQIESDRDLFTREKIVNRLSQYTGSARPVISRALIRSEGRPALPFLEADRTNCFNNCKCHWEWHDLDVEKGNWDVYWRLNPLAEHCETCVVRAELCNPLQIRNFEIVTNVSDFRLYRRVR